MRSNLNRRRLLKTFTAGGAAVMIGKNLPDNWVQPVVESVLLPSHAQTSVPGATTLNYFGQNVSVVQLFEPTPSIVAQISESIISAAHAQIVPGSNSIIEMSAKVKGSMATVMFTPSRPASSWTLFQSTLTTDGTPGTVDLAPGGLCPDAVWPIQGAGPQSVRIVDYTLGDPTITIEITGGFATRSYSIPQGSGTASPVSCSEED